MEIRSNPLLKRALLKQKKKIYLIYKVTDSWAYYSTVLRAVWAKRLNINVIKCVKQGEGGKSKTNCYMKRKTDLFIF